jgi:hypothetical protein
MDADGWLEEDEVARVIAAFVAARGGQPVTRAETGEIIAWANEARRQATALDLVTRGALGVDIDDGRIVFPASQGLQRLVRDLAVPESVDDATMCINIMCRCPHSLVKGGNR